MLRELDAPPTEGRRHPRYRTRSLKLDSPVAGRVVNVGQSGFAVEAQNGLSVGRSYPFKIRLGDKHLRLTGRVQWCRLTSIESDGADGVKSVYRAGIALAETVASKAWREALKRLTGEPAYLIWHRARSRNISLRGSMNAGHAVSIVGLDVGDDAPGLGIQSGV